MSTIDPVVAERHGASHVAPPPSTPSTARRFPIDEWRLVETRFDATDLGVTESLFSVGNGYLGLRGNYEESRDFEANGTFVNGFHETWPIQHAEEAFGFAKVGQTIVNAPDAKVIRLYVDDEPLELSTADIVEYERALDMTHRRALAPRGVAHAERQAGPGRQHPDGVLQPAPPRPDDLRGHPAGLLGPDHDQLAGAQPPGRRPGRVGRDGGGRGGLRPPQGRGLQLARADAGGQRSTTSGRTGSRCATSAPRAA